jgi:AI-2E family transporter
VLFHPRSILSGLGVLLGVAAAVGFLFLAQAGLTLIAIALFLALALNPAVELFQRRGLGRGWAVGAVYALALVVFSLLGLVFIPPLVEQITKFVHALPGLVDDLTKGHGPLGFLERKYQVVRRWPRTSRRPSAPQDELFYLPHARSERKRLALRRVLRQTRSPLETARFAARSNLRIPRV